MLRLLIFGILITSAFSLFAQDKTESATNQQIHISATTAPREINLKEMRNMAVQMQKQIAAFQKGHQSRTNVLRIVYFCAKDSEPFPRFQERIDRVIGDISDFYSEGLQRFGFRSKGLPLERKNGRVVLYIVHGTETAQHYGHESGGKTTSQIRQALEGKIDLDKEHVLVIYNLCRKEPDGRYVFHAPYHGQGNHQSGICHAADCEFLDPRLLTETNRYINYNEYKEKTVAQFNSWYIGGIAHELGHGLGLRHDDATPSEAPQNGASLMSDGNRHYREERWGGSEPAFLSFASALQLASHPLFTGSNRDRWKPAKAELKDVRTSADAGALTISGQIKSEVATYAVIAYLRRTEQKTDHFSMTFPVLVSDNGFKLQISEIPAGTYQVELASCHVNGQITRFHLPFEIVADKQ